MAHAPLSTIKCEGLGPYISAMILKFETWGFLQIAQRKKSLQRAPLLARNIYLLTIVVPY